MDKNSQPLKRKLHISVYTTIVKYSFSFLLTLWAFSNIGSKRYPVAGLIELFLIFVVSNMLMRKKTLGNIVNAILLFLYNAQMMVLAFANSYVSMLMLTNLDSLEALSGKAVLYISAALLAILFSALPVTRFELKKPFRFVLLPFGICMEFIFMEIFTGNYSPMYSYIDLMIQQYELVQLNKTIQAALTDPTGNSELTAVYYNDEVSDYREKDDTLVENPNIILIFTEGLSQSVISDERNIMPNVANYQSQSLSFTNYYNHTFATYRGLIGQLFSGYQLENLDFNPLISIQSILSDQGYHTFMINTEPYNTEFTPYLNSLGFDEILVDTSYECNGMAITISDKDAYEILFDCALEKNQSDEPFFISIYTFGTHASLDSTDQLFGDGSYPALNKFYNADYHFGLFMEKFLNSELAENTIIVFTSDHATYKDEDFTTAFPDYYRPITSFDRIPFFIYYKGIVPEQIDVNGRNTLNLAPTILDYLDISAPNYFLGTSLFAKESQSICETCYSDSYIICTSKDSTIKHLEGSDLDLFKKFVEGYHLTKSVVSAQ